MKILIVGGVAGGATAATRLRRLSESDEIIIFEKDSHIAYANCGLPYYLGGVIKEREKLEVQTPEGLKTRFNVDVKTKHQVVGVNLPKKMVSVLNLETNEEFEESFDKLILSCGAKPVKPNIAGLNDAKNIFTLRNLSDTFIIDDYVKENKIENVVVAGGGFIGIEMAENLAERGFNVVLVEKMPQVLAPLDFEMAQYIHEEMNNHGIELVLGYGVEKFENEGKTVVLENGEKYPSDLNILAIGVTPETGCIKGLDLQLGPRGHVVANETLNVMDNDGNAIEDVFAVGDMIEVINPIDSSPYAVPLAWGANRQGRLVADRINGKDIQAPQVIGASILKVFNLTAASCGMNEKTLRAKNIDFTAIHAHRGNHAGYYPGSSNLALKLCFNKETGQIYGAQGVGKEGTDKRIDVIATAIKGDIKVWDLADIELCYAPPYSSGKDPVNILGYMAENVSDGHYELVYAQDIDSIVANGGYLLDVRTPFEYKNGAIPGSVNIEVDALRESIDKLPKDKSAPVYITCQIGLRGYIAIKILKHHGYNNIYNLSGGYSTYKIFKRELCVVDCKVEPKIELGDLQEVPKEREMKDAAQIEVDVTGMQCPGPLMATYQAVEGADIGDIITIKSSDSGFFNDIKAWTKTNGHELLGLKHEGGNIVAVIKKSDLKTETAIRADQKNATLVLFSGDLDKALASMIIAQGAAAQGKNVTVFFTFWGLNILRKNSKVNVKKTMIEKMFGKMMPRGAKKAKLSKMHMAGMGSAMIKGIMKKKNVDQLPLMLEKAKEAGVQMIACTMSMDLMGIKKEELIDGIEYAGVATYISRNENVGTTLFI